ncbi:hypothetical protein DFH08DRAFT_891974 [Mycena albidolilacea]|uniref:Uncharacterized protein n=1 Tax=Mycena albidolilacea TaxID=1033008 RepID=A0AAD7EF03_9AGAR|nr:hypothetical protein DFH08DRAFT_891974 [Mycena albidolilacea]
MTSSALQVQDICDYVCDFLYESTKELRACSLLSPVFTSSAQRHLFREIGLTGAIGDPSNASHASSRLCSVLAESPHLIRFIRRLRINFEQDILVHLTQVPFTHVESIIMCAPMPDSRFPHTVSALAAPLVALPSVWRLQLIAITFENMESLRTLFHQRTTALELTLELDDANVFGWASMPPISQERRSLQQTMVQVLTINGQRIGDPGWLIHPLSPFSFSTLRESHIWCRTSPSILTLMRSAGPSLHTLRIDAREATPDFTLKDLRGLKILDLFAGFGNARPAAGLLASAGSAELRLEELRVRVSVLGTLDNNSLRHLDDSIAELHAPHLRRVNILVSRITLSWSGMDSVQFAAMMQEVRALFPRLNARGCLRITYLTDGIFSEL